MTLCLSKIAFNINAVMEQTIMIINPHYSPEMVVDGLESGQLQTTVSHQGLDTIGTTITETETGVIVARIREQSVTGQHEIYDFNISDPDFDQNEIDLDDE